MGYFITFISYSGTVTIANGKTLQVQGGGTIKLPIYREITMITGVIYGSDLGYNLLLVSQLRERDIPCSFNKSLATLVRNRQVVASANKHRKTYMLKGSV